MLRATPACTFWTSQLPKVLRATTVCTFSTSQLPKMIRTCQFFTFLTSKCALRSEPVSFSHFWLPNVLFAPNASVFNTFDFQMCLAHLCAATACTFSTSQLPKMLRTCQFFNTFDFAPAALASLLFDPPEPQIITNHWKNKVFRDFSTFSRSCVFFLLILSLLWSSFFFSSLLWLFPPLLFHLSILSEVWLLNFLRPIKGFEYVWIV